MSVKNKKGLWNVAVTILINILFGGTVTKSRDFSKKSDTYLIKIRAKEEAPVFSDICGQPVIASWISAILVWTSLNNKTVSVLKLPNVVQTELPNAERLIGYTPYHPISLKTENIFNVSTSQYMYGIMFGENLSYSDMILLPTRSTQRVQTSAMAPLAWEKTLKTEQPSTPYNVLYPLVHQIQKINIIQCW